MSESVIVTFATTNIAKYCSIKKNLELIFPKVELKLEQIPKDLSVVEGNVSEIINAREKQKQYSKLLTTLVLSTDEGLYLEGAPDSYQPGATIHRVLAALKTQKKTGKELSIYNYLTKYGNKCLLRKVYAIGNEEVSKIIISEIPCIIKANDNNKVINPLRQLNSFLTPIGFSNCFSNMSKSELKIYYEKYLSIQMLEIANFAHSFL